METARANFPDFLPALAIDAFAGLRSAEIERLEWQGIVLAAATAVEPDEAKGIEGRKPVECKANALRHSYASYRYAMIADAGRTVSAVKPNRYKTDDLEWIFFG
ncbi:MAG: hypothetical protein ACLQVX_06440 [Limisphaerales bacterium]